MLVRSNADLMLSLIQLNNTLVISAIALSGVQPINSLIDLVQIYSHFFTLLLSELKPFGD
jgi:hypothetical protein